MFACRNSFQGMFNDKRQNLELISLINDYTLKLINFVEEVSFSKNNANLVIFTNFRTSKKSNE